MTAQGSKAQHLILALGYLHVNCRLCLELSRKSRRVNRHPHLQVKVGYLFGVQIVYTVQDLLEKLSGLLLSKGLLLGQEVEELPTRNKLQDENHIRFVFKDVMEGDDVAVLDLTQDVHLALDLLTANAASARRETPLLDELSGELLPRAFLTAFPNNGKLPTEMRELFYRDAHNGK